MSFVLRKVIWCFTSQVDLAQIFNLIIVASLSMHAVGQGVSGKCRQMHTGDGWVKPLILFGKGFSYHHCLLVPFLACGPILLYLTSYLISRCSTYFALFKSWEKIAFQWWWWGWGPGRSCVRTYQEGGVSHPDADTILDAEFASPLTACRPYILSIYGRDSFSSYGGGITCGPKIAYILKKSSLEHLAFVLD